MDRVAAANCQDHAHARSITLLVIVSLLTFICDVLFLKPQRLRSKLRKQGITGPPPSFLFGNIRDIKRKMQSKSSKVPCKGEQVVTYPQLSFHPFPKL
ncbi:hypothetical protein L1049_012214 [Liquidambar formosana]|uniref:Cytochrome P450 n=1 Tax=Liquidambar formosana TaxID=63359 RepID=A0AAP0RSN4_LIQFO